MSYTRGTWRVSHGGFSSYVDSPIGNGLLQEVAYCGDCSEGNHKDNANLISAAPDMLEILKDMISDDSFLELIQAIGAAPPWFEDAKKAILKAEGKEN